jgi:hypothetical protein
MYMGGFRNDLFNGKGIIKSPHGHFDGSFVDGNRDGFGIHTSPDGSRYEGSFSHDMKNGYGECFSPKNVPLFRGYWQNDKPIQPLQKKSIKEPIKLHYKQGSTRNTH